jgi:hypothetical protein
LCGCTSRTRALTHCSSVATQVPGVPKVSVCHPKQIIDVMTATFGTCSRRRNSELAWASRRVGPSLFAPNYPKGKVSSSTQRPFLVAAAPCSLPRPPPPPTGCLCPRGPAQPRARGPQQRPAARAWTARRPRPSAGAPTATSRRATESSWGRPRPELRRRPRAANRRPTSPGCRGAARLHLRRPTLPSGRASAAARATGA